MGSLRVSWLGFRLGTDSSFTARAVIVPLGKHSEIKRSDQTLACIWSFVRYKKKFIFSKQTGQR